MTTMIVADDEAWIRERLVHTIDWRSLGVEVIEEAACGEEALAKALALNPDMILTDIRMPNMGGLELIQGLRDHGLQAKVIIISGYSDFDYAKQAVSLGAFEYILKPVEDDDLIRIVRRCREQIQSDKIKEELLQKADTQVNKRLPLFKEMIFSNLINGQVMKERETVEALNDLQIRNSGMDHVCVIFHIQQHYQAVNELNADFVQFVIRNIAADMLRNITDHIAVFAHSGDVVAIVSIPAGDDIRERLVPIRDDFNVMVRKILGFTIDMGIGGNSADLMDISSSYRQAKQSLLLSQFLVQERAETKEAAGKPGASNEYEIEAVVNSVKLGDREAVMASLEQLMRHHAQLNPIEYKFAYIRIIQDIARTAFEGKPTRDEFLRSCLPFMELLQSSQSVPEIRYLFEEAMLKIVVHLEKTQHKKKRRVIENIVEYVHENYNKSINLNTVADKFYLNASYLSKIFKEEMEISFSKYIMDYRVGKAVELMKDPTIKIYEIARNVGYDDVQYFTKMFKSIKGVTPVQYREKLV